MRPGNRTMEMTATGAVKINGHLVRRTDDGDWQVSRLGTSIGYVDTLEEADGLIARHLERVRARLALVQRKAGERRAEEIRELALVTGATKRGHTLTNAEFLNKVEDILPDNPTRR